MSVLNQLEMIKARKEAELTRDLIKDTQRKTKQAVWLSSFAVTLSLFVFLLNLWVIMQ